LRNERPPGNDAMARLILIRHGESIANAARRFTHGPHEPLSPRGREEALARARQLAARFDPVALYSSPFVRALETARLVGGVLGLEPIAVDALREQDFGEWRGQPYDLIDRTDRELGAAARWRWRPPGGESLEEVVARAGPAIDAIAERHLGAEVIVVSHGGVMAALQAWGRGHLEEGPVIHANAGGYVMVRRRLCYEGPFALADE
jgi:broad specificity phosphatase PhoE